MSSEMMPILTHPFTGQETEAQGGSRHLNVAVLCLKAALSDPTPRISPARQRATCLVMVNATHLSLGER